jgi:hypothetical protein
LLNHRRLKFSRVAFSDDGKQAMVRVEVPQHITFGDGDVSSISRTVAGSSRT